MGLRTFLIKKMIQITRHPRYFPEIIWSKTQIVHNVFRAYEYFFGRAFGPNGVGDTVRCEMEVHDSYSEGILVERVFVYKTLEARLAQYETNVKNYIQSHFVPLSALFFCGSLAMHLTQPLLLIAGAIAYGSISAVNTTSTPTSVTVSGSDTLGLFYNVGDSAADNLTAVSWGGVSMTKVTAVQNPSDRWTSLWWVANPASGASISCTGGSFFRNYSFYYTGAAQTGQVDSFNTGSNASATSLSVATTVVASNCWLGLCKKDGGGNRTDTASGAITTVRTGLDPGGIAIADSNGTVGTGSQTATISISGGAVQMCAIAFSIKPVATTSVNGNFLMFM